MGNKMQWHQSNNSMTFEERLVDLARRVRADVETLPRCRKRDDLVQQLREIETSVELKQFQ
jgi:hypothetical protein